MQIAQDNDPVAIVSTKRTIGDLDTLIVGADFKPVVMPAGDKLTIKGMLLQAIASHTAEAVEAMRFFRLAAEIHAADKSITLSVEDFTMLRNVVDKNPAKWGALYYGQLYGLVFPAA